MTTIRRFEDIEAWQTARALTRQVYSISMNGPFSKDFGLRDQMRRAAVSVMSNIAEGFERGSQKENIVFLSYAKGSSGELRTQIYIGMDIGYIEKKVGEEWLKEGREISSMLSGLIKTKRGFLKK